MLLRSKNFGIITALFKAMWPLNKHPHQTQVQLSMAAAWQKGKPGGVRRGRAQGAGVWSLSSPLQCWCDCRAVPYPGCAAIGSSVTTAAPVPPATAQGVFADDCRYCISVTLLDMAKERYRVGVTASVQGWLLWCSLLALRRENSAKWNFISILISLRHAENKRM